MRYVFETGAGARSPVHELKNRSEAVSMISGLRFNDQKVVITDIDEFTNAGVLKASATLNKNGVWAWKSATPPARRKKMEYIFTLPLGGGIRKEFISRKNAETHARKLGSIEILEVKNPDQFENRDISIGQGDTAEATEATGFTWSDFG